MYLLRLPRQTSMLDEGNKLGGLREKLIVLISVQHRRSFHRIEEIDKYANRPQDNRDDDPDLAKNRIRGSAPQTKKDF